MREFLLQTLGLKSQAWYNSRHETATQEEKEENSHTKALGYSQARSRLYFDNS